MAGEDEITDVEFTIVPWNSSALTKELSLRAVSSESIQGSFIFDISFKSSQKGFVVQNIRKYKAYNENAARSPGEYDWVVDYETCGVECAHFLGGKLKNSYDCKNIQPPAVDCKIEEYWEIFYIGNEGESWNTDRFAQSFLGDESEGIIFQIGYAYFFPYHGTVKQEKDVVKLTKSIKNIFGPFVGDDNNIALANGLPSSKTQPKMTGLKPIKNVIIHKLTAKWGKHEPKSQLHTTQGWDTIVTEEAFGGAQVYEDFPWGYKDDRPFNLNTAQWDKIDLDREAKYAEPLFQCSLCNKRHYKGDWWKHHDKAPPKNFFHPKTKTKKKKKSQRR